MNDFRGQKAINSYKNRYNMIYPIYNILIANYYQYRQYWCLNINNIVNMDGQPFKRHRRYWWQKKAMLNNFFQLNFLIAIHFLKRKYKWLAIFSIYMILKGKKLWSWNEFFHIWKISRPQQKEGSFYWNNISNKTKVKSVQLV